MGVLLILDANGTPFTRVWCCFEEAMVVRDASRTGAKLLLDVATVDGNGRAHVTTQGPTAADQKAYDALGEFEKAQTSVASIKVKREAGFPKAVLERGFRVNTFQGAATVAIDWRRIVNAICDVPAAQLDATVPRADHPALKEVDAKLSALFAEAALWLAARGDEMESTVAVLTRDTARRQVRLDIPGATIPSLAALAPAWACWPELTSLELDATAAEALTNTSGLQGLAQCKQLAVIKANFALCRALSDVAELGKGVGALQTLQHLQLNFSGCEALSDLAKRYDSRGAFLAAFGPKLEG